MRNLSSLVLTVYALFNVNSVAFAADMRPNSFFFTADTLSNADKLRDAIKFCMSNSRNVVMIIDDQQLNRAILRRKMQTEHYVTFEFTSGDDFLTALRHNALANALVPNSRLAILDNRMPGTLGKDILEILEREELLKYYKNGEREVPAALHTSDERKTIDVPVKYFVRKMSISDLLTIINENNSPPARTRAQTL